MAQLVNAMVGGSALFECFLPNRPSLPDTLVYWQTAQNGGLAVHFYDSGKEDLRYQHRLYQNRTALDFSQLSAGNFSMELRNLTKEDNNTSFYCLFSMSRHKPKLVSHTTLLVQEPLVPTKPPEPSSFPDWAVWLLVALGTLVVLVFVASVIIYKVQRWRKTSKVQITNGTANGTTDGTANGTSNGAANGTANGAANGTASGAANGTANDMEEDGGDVMLIVNKVVVDKVLEEQADPLLGNGHVG
ncbi:hypothetical protein ACEWY4_022798 [Coilia grayii]|uniref:Immunoglobulin V-set domain-containing protein n=1 Tax=Coilia grayii TaxID=363190 RepID=A0ABD1J161_9TELE